MNYFNSSRVLYKSKEQIPVFSIFQHEVPKDIVYCRIFCKVRLQNKYMHRVRFTISGYNITYTVPFYTPTSYITTVKLHWNIFLSTPDTRYHKVDVKSFYPNNTMNKKEYYNISITLTPQDIINKYELLNKKINVYFYIRVVMVIYSLV